MKVEFTKQTAVYPIVLIPDEFFDFLKNDLKEDVVANEIHLSKPYRKYLEKPVEPLEYITQVRKTTKVSKVNGCLLFIIPVASIGLASIVSNSFSEGVGLALLFIIVQLIFTYWSGESLIKFEDETESIRISKSSDEVYKLKGDHNKAMKKYFDNKKAYEVEYKSKLEVYEKMILQNKQKVKIKLYKKLLSPLVNASRGKPSIKRGVAELKFLEKLDSVLKGLIFIDMVPKFNNNHNDNTYNPDFTLICKTTNLHIDIEIDEPYTLKEKTPIHYLDNLDDDRNNFFLKNNWCIIRFSERQIIQQTAACIETIKSVYENLLDMKSFYSTNLTLDKRWSYEESFIMQNNRVREKYLVK